LNVVSPNSTSTDNIRVYLDPVTMRRVKEECYGKRDRFTRETGGTRPLTENPTSDTWFLFTITHFLRELHINKCLNNALMMS